MDELLKIIKEINKLSEYSSPVIHDYSEKALEFLRKNKLFTMREVVDIIDRMEGFELFDEDEL